VAGDTRVPVLTERLDGFHDGIRDARLDPAEQLVLVGIETEALRAELASRLSDLGLTAVIACSTPLATASLQAIESAGRMVPTDTAFATFDGFNHSDLFHPRITTVRQPAFDMGIAAVRLLMERIESPNSSPRTVRLHQSLELRDSTEQFPFRTETPTTV
jgi:LacI family transcriptional regulator